MSSTLGSPATPTGSQPQPATTGLDEGQPSAFPPPHHHHGDGDVPHTKGEGFAGWGEGDKRFGGMAQMGLRDPLQEGDPSRSPSPAPAASTTAPSRPAAVSRTLSSDSASSTSSGGSTSSFESDIGLGTGPRSVRQEVSDTEADAGAGIGGAGYGRAVRSLDEDEANRMQKERHKKARAQGDDSSKSYHSGMGQGYMRMIHALAQEDEEEERRAKHSKKQSKRDKKRNRKAKHHAHSADEAPVVVHGSATADAGTEPPSPSQLAAADFADPAKSASASPSASQQGPDLADFTSAPERAAANPSLLRCDSGVHRREEHPASSSSAAHPGRHRGARGESDLSQSSIFAIHRPIERRRKTLEDVRNAQSQGGSANGDDDVEENDGGDEDEAEESADDEASREEKRRREREKRLARREKLADKLMDVFGLDEPEEVVAEYPCWLFRAILLQGFLYVTAGHLCFYAYLAQKEGTTVRSGSLSVRSSRTRRYGKHWFVLKDSVFSWFPSSTDPYFPDGHIDLHYAISVEPSQFHKHHFKVATSDKKWHFSADSEASRDEWVKTLKKGVFRCQNEGESVKIAIPLETIVDVEKSSSLEFAETIRVRVYDADEGYSIDEYWLSYFKDLDGALDKISTVLEAFRQHHPHGGSASVPPAVARGGPAPEVEDTTKHMHGDTDLGDTDQVRAANGEHDEQHGEQRDKQNEQHAHRSRSISQRVSSVLSPLGRSSSRSSRKGEQAKPALTPPTPAAPPKLRVSTEVARETAATPTGGSVATLRPPQAGDDAQREGGGDVPLEGVSPMAAAAGSAPLPPPVGVSAPMDHDGTVPTLAPAPSAPLPAPEAVVAAEQERATSTPTPPSQHTYPPNPAPGAPRASTTTIHDQPPRRTSTLSKVLSAPASAASSVSQGGRRILEVVTHSSVPGRTRRKGASSAKGGKLLGGPVVEEPAEEDLREGDEEGKATPSEVDEFRRTFGLSNKEVMLERFPAYLFRGLPIFGHVYISSEHFCFRSAGLITAKTKMILPLSDIIGVSKHRSYRIGYSGLMIIIKGHEEVFFELNNSDRRDACLAMLDEQRELVKKQKRDQSGDDKKDDESQEHQQLRDLLDLSEARSAGQSPLDLPHPRSEAVQGQPPIMFSSTTSDFITFKPDESLRVTCLTIGSRGDVQPYIALCKGLMAQGHKCKIASHGEYRKWVEGHGIEFSAVGGDPAELMQLMISHDFFTISFMKEAVGRFRGWLDDLLASAWKACQNTDLLIESPSAIAGFHVAEALRIPYYRAFTMPWSRTRAYPHAFAVPEVHMGGGYNYMTYTMFDQVFWRATSGQVNRWRRDTLKLKPTSLEAMQQHKIPFLYNFSPVVIPPPLDWRENIHVTGYWWLDNPDDSDQSKWEPPEELTKWLDEAKNTDKKVVFIGFGSIIIPDPLEMTRVVVEAAEKAGVYAIVAKGWSDRQKGDDDDGEPDEEKEKKREENEKRHQELMNKPFIFSVKSIPHDWLFPRIHAAVHHGGAGTTGASLRAGLPTIIKPFFGDQHFYADRVSTLGIGSHVRNFTVENLTEALKTAVSDDKQIERARLAGEEIRKEDGVATAIECIYRDLEYARSLVPPPTTALVEGEIAEVEVDDDSSDDDSDSSSSSSSSGDEDEKDEKVDEKAHLKERDAADGNEGRPATSAPPTEKVQGVLDPSRSAHDPSSPSHRDESRTTSSDEGWDVMSRGSAADTTVSASWEDGGDASRASSKARSVRSGPEGGVEGAGGEEDDGGAGLTARMLGFLGKPVKAVKKDS
ncbi:hypothetical protein JCM8208_001437 [Rhodotorula glutinis]